MLKGFKATADPKELYRIGRDKDGNETSRVLINIDKNQGDAKEFADFIANGGIVEEAETQAELDAKKAKEDADAVEAMHNTCLLNLKETDHKVLPDSPYDVSYWTIKRNKWRLALKSNVLIDIPSLKFD